MAAGRFSEKQAKKSEHSDPADPQSNQQNTTSSTTKHGYSQDARFTDNSSMGPSFQLPGKAT